MNKQVDIETLKRAHQEILRTVYDLVASGKI